MSGIQYQNIAEQLHFENDIFPCIIVNDGRIANLAECEVWIKENKQELESMLATSGALLFRGFPVDSAEAFDQFSLSFGYPNFTYQESLSNAVRINYTERVFTANEAPKDVEIYLHHEMAQTPIFPSKLFFFCQTAAESGGMTPLCRSDKLFEALQNKMPDLTQDFIDKGLQYTTVMPANDDPESGQGRSWRSTLSVDNKTQAESKLAELGYRWHWLMGDQLKVTTPVLPAVMTLGNGKQTFFNQLIAAFLGWKGVRENPASAVNFGDDTAIPIAALELIVDLSNEFTVDLPWQDGDVAIVDNFLTMHGRRPYSGERKRFVLVALVA